MVSRRTFITTSAAAAGALVAPSPLHHLAAQSVPRRRRISELSNSDPVVRTYRAGVRALKARTSGVTWNAIAKVHADFCPHGNWYFLPWHRAYLVMVENIIREVTGDRSFAMPYWDWARDRRLPAQFNAAAIANNPLFERSRDMTPQFQIPNEVVGPAVMSGIMGEESFETFGSSRPDGQDSTDARWIRAPGTDGPLENNPHNQIHGTVGGVMGTYDSPRDPIFWLHHCNIDRLWAQWNQDGNQNSDDEHWLDMNFTDHFFRPDGTRYSVRVRDLLEILPLGYRYGLGPEQPDRPIAEAPLIVSSIDRQPRAAAGRAAGAATGRRSSAAATEVAPGRPLTVAVPVAAADVRSAIAARSRGRAAAGRAAGPAKPGPRVLAVVRDITAPADATNTRIRVFIETGGGSAALDPASPGFVGTFGFFGLGHTGHSGHGGARAATAPGGGRSVLLDLTPALKRLQAAGKPIGDKIEVKLVAVPNKPGATAVAVVPARIDIAVE